MKTFYLLMSLVALFASVNAQHIATFDDFSLQPDSYWNGSDVSGGFSSGKFWFPNNYNSEWGSWSGFSVSNMKDTLTAGYINQFSAITASGVDGSENYAVAYIPGELKMNLEDPTEISGFFITNATYSYLSMRDGDDFSKKFGGQDGNDKDYFKLTVSGVDIYGNDTEFVGYYLADFRADNPDSDYIVNTWEWVDLSSLGVVTELNFSLESTDTGDWGMNTPSYFCMDNFNGIPSDLPPLIAEAHMEDCGLAGESYYNGSDGAGFFVSGGFIFKNNYNTDYGSWSGFAASTMSDTETRGWMNQYSAITGKGALGTYSYAVGYNFGITEIEFEETVVTGFYITNSTYSYWSVIEGDNVAKRFGGVDGSDPDWFKVTVAGISATGDTTGTIDYYLADYRFKDNEKDYVIDDWQWLDVTSLGEIVKLRFSLSSSDNGDWGMNTPAYFCIDQLNHQDLPPEVLNPVEDINMKTGQWNQIYLTLDSIFTDPDNPDSLITLELEYNDNPDLLSCYLIAGEKSVNDHVTILALSLTPGITGKAEVTISALSNGKKIYHSFSIVVDTPVSAGIIKNAELKVYPNPFRNNFFVELPPSAEEMFLFEQSGKIIFKKSINHESILTVPALANKPPGIYFVKIKTMDGYFTSKLIKN